MDKLKIVLTTVFSLCLLSLTRAQEVEMADDFRGEGKIYVVVAVILIILIGIFVQMMRLDRKVRALEKENDD